ncbi:hypothetical protein KEJ47_08825 [Candidatus Bathyarchaeota archaeon]|nr:hypothetical protein [Candidatus Bathyarchaeota archaeon]
MSNHIVVRVDPADKELAVKVATARGEDLSDLVRRAIKIELARLSFLSPEEKKALGILEAPK